MAAGNASKNNGCRAGLRQQVKLGEARRKNRPDAQLWLGPRRGAHRPLSAPSCCGAISRTSGNCNLGAAALVNGMVEAKELHPIGVSQVCFQSSFPSCPPEPISGMQAPAGYLATPPNGWNGCTSNLGLGARWSKLLMRRVRLSPVVFGWLCQVVFRCSYAVSAFPR